MKLTLPLPPSINQTYGIGGGHMYKKRLVRDWEEECGWIIRKDWKMPMWTTPIMLDIDFHIPYPLGAVRDRDIDNSLKVLLDVLQHQGVFFNDKLVTAMFVKKINNAKTGTVDIQVNSID